MKKITTFDFITKSKLIHGDKYDYSCVDYLNARNSVEIICHIHGIFIQKAWYHLSGSGCPKCANNLTSNTDDFIKKSFQIAKVKENNYLLIFL